MNETVLEMQTGRLAIAVRDAAVQFAYLRRSGTLAPLVCLHGFGSTKEDYTDLALHPAFDGRGGLRRVDDR